MGIDLDKQYSNPKLQQKQQAERNRLASLAAMRAGKTKKGGIRHQLEEARRGVQRSQHGDSGAMYAAFASCKDQAQRDALYRLYQVCLNTKLIEANRRAFDRLGAGNNFRRHEGLNNNSYPYGLVQLARHHARWIRDPESVRFNAYNASRQFSALARHLLAKYEVPVFMDAAFFGDFTDTLGSPHRSRVQDWFVHIGQGGNIRKAEGLPIPFTKRMAHHFLQAPAEYTIENAIRWAQIHALDGDARLVEAILPTLLGDRFHLPSREEFWETVLRFFIENPMLDTAHVGPIIDYLNNQRYVPDRRNDGEGRIVEARPPQPNLSMKGRTAETLLRQVEEWHAALVKRRKQSHFEWPACGIEGLNRKEGDERNQTVYVVRELLSTKELNAEGAEMGHCVGSYSYSCTSGQSAIFTMKRTDRAGTEGLLTIEVAIKTRVVRQARGRLNARPSPEAMRILRVWATEARLSLSSYL